MAKKGLMQDLTSGIDEPLESGIFDIFKRGKIQCRIIYEDGSFKDFYKKFKQAYCLTIKGRTYFVIPKCIMRGRIPSITWFFNNPMPINFAYQQSTVTALELIEPSKLIKCTDEQREVYANIKIDAEGLQSVFTTKLMKGLYDTGGVTAKNVIIILIVVTVIILVILQLTGYIDLQGIISG